VACDRQLSISSTVLPHALKSRRPYSANEIDVLSRHVGESSTVLPYNTTWNHSHSTVESYQASRFYFHISH
jgi:hypothetical protein